MVIENGNIVIYCNSAIIIVRSPVKKQIHLVVAICSLAGYNKSILLRTSFILKVYTSLQAKLTQVLESRGQGGNSIILKKYLKILSIEYNIYVYQKFAFFK